MKDRIERDTLGEIRVPDRAYWGSQTQRAVENFPVSGRRLQPAFVRAQAIIKRAAALANMASGVLEPRIGKAIAEASEEIIDGKLRDQFVVDVYQSGAGTSQNMNANEVIAGRAAEILGSHRGDRELVHPNDHVNRGHSTNDTIPAAMHISSLEEITRRLTPALGELRAALEGRRDDFDGVIKAGRTHMQDAVPMRLGQEFGAYARMIEMGIERVGRASEGLRELAIGGSAVGTGINTEPGYADLCVKHINEISPLGFRRAENLFEAIQSRDAAVHVSGALRTLATSILKIAGDVILLSSGPRTGLNELSLPAVQPGSSVMPGKVNPTMAEMMSMVCFQVLGNDHTVARAAQAGQLELNVMMPVIAYNLLDAIEILANGVRAFTTRCVAGIKACEDVCRTYAESTAQVATALSPHIGYERAAGVVKEAIRTNRSVRDVVLEMKLLTPEELERALDLRRLT